MHQIHVNAATIQKEKEDNDSKKNANVIKTKKPIKGRMNSTEDKDYFKYTVDTKGYFNIYFENISDSSDVGYGWRWYVYDQNLDELYCCDGVKTKAQSNTFDFKKGTVIYIKVENRYSHKDLVNKAYKLTVEAVESSSWEQEENNSPKAATILKANKKKYANLYTNADEDYYKFSIEEKGPCKFTFENESGTDNYGYGWRVSVYDADLKQISTLDFKTKKESQIYSFKKGTVLYLKIEAKYSNHDVVGSKYSVKVATKENSKWEEESNDSYKDATTIKSGTMKYGNLLTEKDEDFYKIKASESKEMKISFEPDKNSVSYGWSIIVYDDSKQEVASCKGIKAKEIFSWNAKKNTTYYIVVSSRYQMSDTVGIKYTLKVK